MIEQAIVSRLVADMDILQLVYHTADATGDDSGELSGGEAEEGGIRIWPNRPHQGKFPCIVYRRISTNRPRNLLSPDGLSEARIEIESWGSARTYFKAKKLAERCRLLLDLTTGVGWCGAGHDVVWSYLDDEEDRLRKPVGEKEAIWPTVLQEFVVWFYESTV